MKIDDMELKTRHEPHIIPRWIDETYRSGNKTPDGRAYFYNPPSYKRKMLRGKIFSILKSNSEKEGIDEVITFYEDLYVGTRYKGLTKQERMDLFLSRGGKCMWCKEDLSLATFTIEHIKPRIEGGTYDPENLGIACQKCNNERGGEVFTKEGFLIKKKRNILSTLWASIFRL